MKRMIALIAVTTVLLTGCGQSGETGASDPPVEIQTSAPDITTVSETTVHKVNDADPFESTDADRETEPIVDIGEAYFQEVSDEDIAVDTEHGIKYAKNQLLISVFPETEKTEIKKIADETDAEIIGFIELTGDYQIEFRENKSLEELETIADHINSYSFVINVTLNLIHDETPAAEGSGDSDSIEDGYVAVFQGGVGELMHRTYVYRTDDGFRYVNAKSTTVSYGSPQWRTRITNEGTAATKEEIIEIAKENDAGQFARFPDDTMTYKLKEFLEMDW